MSGDSRISVRLWVKDAPSPGQPYRFSLPAVPPEGGLVRTPWAAARRVEQVAYDIDPGREPVLIVDIFA